MTGEIEFVEQIWWYVSRAAGIVAWVLLSLSVLAGMSIAHRRAGTGSRSSVLPTGWPLDLHRFLSTLSLVFLLVHIFTLIPDNFVHFGLAELFVPMQSEWEPSAVAWGIVALWLVVAVEVTSLLRHRLPHRVWRIVHTASFGVWAASTVHLFLAGTDAAHPVFRALQVGLIGLVCTALIVRVARVTGPRSRELKRRKSVGVRPLPVEEPIHVDQVDAGEGRELAA